MPSAPRSLWSSRPATVRADAVPVDRQAMLTRRLPEIALVAANLVPVFGALFLGWSAFDVMLAYWTESAVIGVFNVLKILLASGPGRGTEEMALLFPVKVFVACFFVVHFGFFMFGHGVFLFAMFGDAARTAGGVESAMLQALRDSLHTPLLWALAASHGCAFVIGYLWNGAWRRTFFMTQMFSPYRRIFAMHLALMGSALPVLLLGAPAVGVAILVAAKVAADLWVLRKELGPGEAAPAGAY
ncbi:MAG TPA: DUF6498-containing protein [Longimicrobium sp.]|nr:DUF6498-containing protein [Longimicrobium sp.]